MQHRVVLELIAVHSLQRMVNGIAGVAPDGHLGRGVIRKGLERSCVASRHRQLRCRQAICQGNLVRIIDILQVNTPVCHPSDLELAVPPDCHLGGQVPLPAVGLLRAGIKPLVRRAAQRHVKCATLRGAYCRVPIMQWIRSSVGILSVDNS